MPDRIRQAVGQFLPLAPEAFRDVGVHTGNSADLLIGQRPTQGRCAPIREGRDVQRYHLGPARRWVRLDLAADDGRYWRIGAAQTYGQARLLIRQTADRPIAARHDEPAYFRNSVLAFFGQDGLDDDYVLAVLNSRLAACLHRLQYGDASQRAFPQVKVGHLRSLRLPQEPMEPLEPTAREQVRRLQRQLDEALRSKHPHHGIALDIDGATVVVLEHLLAHLGRTMTRLAQAHSELVSQTRPGLSQVRHVPKQESSARRELEAHEATAAICRVAQRLARADALTDELVYRIYGLTAEDSRLLEALVMRPGSFDRSEGLVWG